MSALDVLIAGGGIGGLTAALCLAKTGHRVSVFEQADEFAARGAGIQLSPNCTRVLRHVGLAEALSATACEPEAVRFRHWRTGKVIAEMPLGSRASERYGAPYYHVHRGDLLRALLEAARCADISLQARAPVTAIRQDPAHVEVRVRDTPQTGDLLVGADGIHSTTRAVLRGPENPRFTGYAAWRSLVPAEHLSRHLVRPMATVWWGPGKHFVHYSVRRGELVNCVCVVRDENWKTESWTQRGDLAELEAAFAHWHGDVRELIEHVDRQSVYKWALFDRPPFAGWVDNRVALLGDACHPMLPFMAQGAAMAIEDAAVLARCLSHSDDIAGALRRYEKQRYRRTAPIQNGSRRNAVVYHMPDAIAWLRNLVVRATGQRTMDRLYSYDPIAPVDS